MIKRVFIYIKLGAAILIILKCLGFLGSVLFGAEIPDIVYINLYKILRGDPLGFLY